MGNTYALCDPAPISVAPTGKAFHFRATVTGVAGSLGSFLAAGALPGWVDPNDASRWYFPISVQLQAEVGTDACYVTMDGQSTASATLGFLIPTAPQVAEIPCPTGLKDDTLSLFSAGTSHIQCLFKMAPFQVKP